MAIEFSLSGYSQLTTVDSVMDLAELDCGMAIVSPDGLYAKLNGAWTYIGPMMDTVEELDATLSQHMDVDDPQRWQAIIDLIAQTQAETLEQAKEIYEGTAPNLDYTNGTVLVGQSTLINLGGGSSWTVPTNGGIICKSSALVNLGGVLYVNDEPEWDAVAVGGKSKTIYVNAGDTVSFSAGVGILSYISVIFYPNLGV
jgi:hypothetical protein